MKKVKLDIACGKRKQPGYMGVDIVKMPGVDIVHDLTKFPWPIKSDSVDEVHCSHYVEHTPDLIGFMNELYRIMKMGGIAKIYAPYYNSVRCWQDPTHKRAISENSFFYYFHDWMVVNGLDHYGINVNFKINYEFAPNQEFLEKNKMAYEGKSIVDWPCTYDGQAIYFPLQWALKHLTNAIDDIYVVLEKKPMKWKPEQGKI